MVQRVSRAEVATIEPSGSRDVTGSIGAGLCVLVGVTHDDDQATVARLADKLFNLRIFDDADGVMNLSLADRLEAGVEASVLIVSQFTLYGDVSRGRRPSWIDAARPEVAEPLIDQLVERLRSVGLTVGTGRFRTQMAVDLV
ncbi:D-aminoacyl-tRNA deacylase, partial [Arthrospira platensis SPKY2]